MSRDFRHFFWLKNSTWASYEQAKTFFCEIFRLRKDISYLRKFAKTHLSVWSLKMTRCWCGHWLREHRVRVVVDCVETSSAWSLTTWTLCQHSQQLCGHCVNVVNDYVGTCQYSQQLRPHTANYVTLEKEKLTANYFTLENEKTNDKGMHSCWLRGHLPK